jgi:hypothetical protein
MRATQPMGEKPRDWIRLLPPTVRRDPRVTVLCERLSTLHNAGAGVERLLGTAADLHRRPPSSPPMRSGGASSGWRRGIDRRHRRRLGESQRPHARGKRSGYAKSVSRRRTGCCIGLIDQARPWGVRRRRAQLRVAMSRPRGTPWRVCSIFIRFRSPELASLPNSFCYKVTAQGTHTTLWK